MPKISALPVTTTITGSELIPIVQNGITKQITADVLLAGFSWKTAVKVRTTGNIVLSGLQTIDTILVSEDDRILVMVQTAPAENGIYLAKTGAWVRTEDANIPIEFTGMAVHVADGSATYKNTGWVQSSTISVLDTDPVTFVQVFGFGTYVAGTGISLVGNQFNNTGVLSLIAGPNISVSGGTGDITVGLTGIVPVTSGGTGVTTSTGTGSVVLSDSPTLTGIPIAPTAIAGTNTTQLATTAHVFAERSNAFTLTNKTLNLASNTLLATSAQLAAALTDETGTGSVVFSTSPALTGTPTAPTAVAGTNTTQLATTAHVFAERTNTATISGKTFSDNPTFSAGTINGVTYLNGSKVLTSGTGLVFDGTNLGIGTSSPSFPLVVSSGGAQGLEFGPTAVNSAPLIQAYDRSLGGYLQLSDYSLTRVFFTGTSPAERMRIDSSGNLGIGTSGPVSKLHVSGDIQQDNANYLKGKLAAGTTTRLFGLNVNNTLFIGSIDANHTGGTIFVKNGVEQARIDSSGNLLVGTTAIAPGNGNNNTGGSLSATGILFASASGIISGSFNRSTSDGDLISMRRDNNQVGSISVTATATSYNTSSDRRLKKNIAPAAPVGELIDAIEIVSHDWKAGGHTDYGVIAQDLHAIYPNAVTPGDTAEEIERSWAVDYSKLVPLLVKEIQAVRSRLNTLEEENALLKSMIGS